MVSPDEIGHLDIAIDGADEVDPDFNLTKGAGGAHTREKLVARMSDRFIVVVDESKLVDHLGPFGTPLEVLDFAPASSPEWVRGLGATEVTARADRSDNGNLIMDAQFGRIDDPAALMTALSAVPGLVEHGLFAGAMVERVVVAGTVGRPRAHPLNARCGNWASGLGDRMVSVPRMRGSPQPPTSGRGTATGRRRLPC